MTRTVLLSGFTAIGMAAALTIIAMSGTAFAGW